MEHLKVTSIGFYKGCWARLKMLKRDKHSSLISGRVNDERRKKFCETVTAFVIVLSSLRNFQPSALSMIKNI